MLENKVIGFVGAGALATALLRGLLSAGTVQPEKVMITDMDSSRVEQLVNTWKVTGCSKGQLVEEAGVIILAVKPKDIAAVMEEIGSKLVRGQVLISVAAGIPTAFIEGFCQQEIEVVRVMPNTSCTVLASATAISRGKHAGDQAEETAADIFSAVGKVEKVKEELFDVITGLSGSGPAYVYYMVEALEQAGERLGLPREMALNLAIQTLSGAAKMLVETGEKPKDLRTAVTSPGGTTFAGLQALDSHGFHKALFAAVEAAANRSKEMQAEFTGITGV